jgi:hypothetical protein
MKTYIFITTVFEGWHRWKDAPQAYAYLREWHRHLFHVKVWMGVSALNRQIEFIEFKSQVNDLLSCWSGFENKFELSCEQLAEELMLHFNAAAVEVSEDGENGALLRRRTNEDLCN